VRAAPLSPIARSDTVFEIAALGIFFAWWVGWLDFTSVIGSGVAMRFTTLIEPFYWPIVVLSVIDLARLAVDFLYPYRTWPRVLTQLIMNVAWLIALVIAFRPDGLLEATTLVDTAAVQSAVALTQTIFRIVVAGLAIVTAALIATDVVRLFRR
jgi:hypothetical protein